ncbi:MAG: hypothetical protein Kow002_03720 [Anaerolineales bacterium]
MADISAIFGILLILGIAFPGMLTATWLLLPTRIDRARAQIAASLWKVFWSGLVGMVVMGLPIIILITLPFGPAKFVGFSLIALVLAFSTLGAAGITAHMAAMLTERAPNLSPAGAFVRAGVALELAAFFPLIGWFVFMPLAIVFSVGATFFALFGRSPKEKPAPAVETTVSHSQA